MNITNGLFGHLRTSFFLILWVLAASVGSVYADSWGPFLDFRQVDPTGRYYLVVKQLPGNPRDPGRGTSVSFEFAERVAGSAPVGEERDNLEWTNTLRLVENPKVCVREGDIVHGRGKLSRCPRLIVISTAGNGFVGFDVRGYNFGLQGGDALIVVDKNGTMRFAKILIDLFKVHELDQLGHSGGGIEWLRTGWIDEKRKLIVVISNNVTRPVETSTRFVRLVSLESGAVHDGSLDEIVTAIAEANRSGLESALGLAIELKLESAKEHLPKIWDNEELPILSRIQAAVGMAMYGDKRGGQLMKSAALEKGPAQRYAIENLPALLGDKAAPVLCAAVRQFGDRIDAAAAESMDKVSADAGVDELMRLLDDKPSTVAQQFAMECLGNKRAAAKSAVPSLIKVLHNSPVQDDNLSILSTHQFAAIALGRIGAAAEEAVPRLTELSEDYKRREQQWLKEQQLNPQRDRLYPIRFPKNYFLEAIAEIRKSSEDQAPR